MLSVEISKELHKAIKMRAIEQDRTVREVVTEILEKAVGARPGKGHRA